MGNYLSLLSGHNTTYRVEANKKTWEAETDVGFGDALERNT